MKANKVRTWGIALAIVLVLVMLEAYIDMHLHKMLALVFIAVFIGHAISTGKGTVRSKISVTLYVAFGVVIISGIFNIVFKVQDNTSAELISNIIHQLASWAMVVLATVHSITYLQRQRRR